MKDIKYIRDALRWVLNIPGYILAISGVVWVGVVMLSFVVGEMLYRRVVQRKSWREAWDLAWRTTTTNRARRRREVKHERR